jgi:hypothetical protein
MRDADQLAFSAVFLKLRKIFGLRGDQGDLNQVMESYFRAMLRFPLRAVEAGADAWIAKGEHFPKPAQWMACMPSQQNALALPVMVEPDVTEYRRAISLHYEDEPCGCHECKSADVSHRMLRYVPDSDRDDQDVKLQLDGKVVVKGHWAHGQELARWYAARDAYFALRDQFAGKLPRRMKAAPVEVA